ncbi:MAG: hypothetical protein WC661_10535 [Opitutaceae bacterium]|jgi:hypothetical protein
MNHHYNKRMTVKRVIILSMVIVAIIISLNKVISPDINPGSAYASELSVDLYEFSMAGQKVDLSIDDLTAFAEAHQYDLNLGKKMTKRDILVLRISPGEFLVQSQISRPYSYRYISLSNKKVRIITEAEAASISGRANSLQIWMHKKSWK